MNYLALIETHPLVDRNPTERPFRAVVRLIPLALPQFQEEAQ